MTPIPATLRSTLAGLHFVRSGCDRRAVAAAGNLLADFRFHTARIGIEEADEQVWGAIRVPGAGADFSLRRDATPQVEPGSPFPSVHAAMEALKYPPCGLSPAAGGAAVNAVRIARDESVWRSVISLFAAGLARVFGGHFWVKCVAAARRRALASSHARRRKAALHHRARACRR